MRSPWKIAAAIALVGGALLLLSAYPEPSHAGDPTDGFTLAVFPIGLAGVTAYNAAIVSTTRPCRRLLHGVL